MHKMSESGDLCNNLTVVQGAEEETDVYISRGKLQIFMFVLAVLLIPLFCLFGSVGNVLSLRVLFHQRMRNQTNYMLAALCISDTLFLIHCLIFTGINIYKKTNPVEGEALRAKIYPVFGAYGSVVTARITSCLTTLLCVERYVAVYYPMQAKLICSKKNTIIAIILIYVITLLAFIPFSLKYRAVEDVGNTTLVYLNKTQYYISHVKFFSIYGSILNILFRFSPLVIIPVLNICMIRAVHQTWKLRREMSGHDGNSRRSSKGVGHYSSTDQHRITVMLVTVAFIFFLCILPGAINSIVTHIMPTYSRIGKYKNLYLCISSVTFLFETINSSVNFIIYMAMCRKFRLLYKEIFCCGHGQYYNKISVSSVKDRFKWVSAKKRSDSDSNEKCSCRATVSDCGPIRNKPIVKKRSFNGIHSEGYVVADEESSSSRTDRALWVLDRKGMHGYLNTGDTAETLNGEVSCNGCTCTGGPCHKQDLSNETPNLSKMCRKTLMNGCLSKRHTKHTKEPIGYSGHGDKRVRQGNGIVAINYIYNMDQEIPLMTDLTTLNSAQDKM